MMSILRMDVVHTYTDRNGFTFTFTFTFTFDE